MRPLALAEQVRGGRSRLVELWSRLRSYRLRICL